MILLEDSLELANIPIVVVANQIADLSISFLGLGLGEHQLCLHSQPFFVWLEYRWRTNHSPRLNMKESQCKCLLELGLGNRYLAEKIDLPKRFSMDLHKLVLSALASLRARMHHLFFENRMNSVSTNAVNSQFLEFFYNSTITPLSFTSQAEDNLSNRFQRFGAAYSLGRFLTIFFPTLPASVISRMNYRNGLQHSRSYGLPNCNSRSRSSLSRKMRFLGTRSIPFSALKNSIWRRKSSSKEVASRNSSREN